MAQGTRKAFAYLRVSGKGQVEGDGFPRQLKAIKDYAAACGIRIVAVYRKEGVSGTKDLENRPAFLEMLEALLSDGVRLVLIEKLDRLARDLLVQETIIGELRKSGFELISVLEPDLLEDDPSRKLMRQVFGAIAEYEKTMTVLKLRGARNRMRTKTGKCEGRKPFGFYEGEDAVIERMQALRGQGLGYRSIAGSLNDAGIAPRRGSKWHASAVRLVLLRG
jgi:DNA invertase Pin-like site-specific DNA recombinase